MSGRSPFQQSQLRVAPLRTPYGVRDWKVVMPAIDQPPRPASTTPSTVRECPLDRGVSAAGRDENRSSPDPAFNPPWANRHGSHARREVLRIDLADLFRWCYRCSSTRYRTPPTGIRGRNADPHALAANGSWNCPPHRARPEIRMQAQPAWLERIEIRAGDQPVDFRADVGDIHQRVPRSCRWKPKDQRSV